MRGFVPLLPLLTLLIIILSAPPTTAVKPNVTFCYLPRISSTNAISALHSAFSVDLNRHLSPSINWNFEYVSVNGNPAVKNSMKAILTEEAKCNVWLGPGSSISSITVSTVIEQPWVDYASTSLALSSKKEHPYFSRTIPDDGAGGWALADLAIHHNWKVINVLCSEESYGRSISSSFGQHLHRLGGSVAVSACIGSDDSVESVKATLGNFERSKSRVTLVAISTSVDSWDSFVTAVVEMGLHKKHVFLLTESACSGNLRYLEITGSLCVTFKVNQTLLDQFMFGYKRKSSQYVTDLLAEGVPPRKISANRTSIYGAFAHDAVKHVMQAYEQEQVTKGTLDFANKSKMLSVIRGFVSQGMTGKVTMNEMGDRPSAAIKILNSQPSGEVEVGSWSGDAGILLTTEQPNSNTRIFWLNNSAHNTVPPNLIEEKKKNNLFIVIICLVVLAVLITFISILLLLRSPAPGKNLADAPRDKEKKYAIVLIDIEAAAHLWARAPEAMAIATDKYQAAIRDLVQRHRGFEVQYAGDSFMIAFSNPYNAVKFGTNVQTEFVQMKWETAINKVYSDITRRNKNGTSPHRAVPTTAFEMEEEEEEQAEDGQRAEGGGKKKKKKEKTMWNGLRIRVGVNFDLGDIYYDEKENTVNYLGNCVKVASALESVGHGGQVLITGNVKDVIDWNKFPTLKLLFLGNNTLHDITDPVPTYQIAPIELEQRSFPPLRLHVVATHFDLEEVDSESEAGSSQASRLAPIMELAKRNPATKRGIMSVDEAENQLQDAYEVIRTLFSVMPKDKRAATLTNLCEGWRIPLPKKKPRARKAAYILLLYFLSARVCETIAINTLEFKDYQDSQHSSQPGSQ